MFAKRIPALILIVLCLGGLIVFLAFGSARLESFARRVSQSLKYEVARTKGGPYASSDLFLNALQIPEPSETLRATMASLPPDETALLVGTLNEPAFRQSLLTVSYLSWPRQIAAVGCDEAAASGRVLYRPRDGVKIGYAIFFMRQPPEAMAGKAQAIGPNLKLVRVSENNEPHLTAN